ncbi:MAG: NAD(P)-dependent oxidoreductase, partial [Gemmatimonadetes bacterium]|nr:NAD(P)-dependent oxidoreductase [Gemmatimonadota bacterium]
GWPAVLRHNLIGTYNVFEAARRAGVRRVVVGSSNLAMGGYYLDPPYRDILAGRLERAKRPYRLIDEGMQVRPLGFYGVSKAYQEALGSFYRDFYGLSVICLRIGYVMTTDNPAILAAALSLWLSHRDTAQVHIRAIDAPETVRHAVLNATSDNHWKIFSLDRARDVIGYEPEDDAGEIVRPGPLPERDSTELKLHMSDVEEDAADELVRRSVYRMLGAE